MDNGVDLLVGLSLFGLAALLAAVQKWLSYSALYSRRRVEETILGPSDQWSRRINLNN